MAIERMTVDLTAFPDLVVIYLGMKAHNEQGRATLFGFAPQIEASVATQPDGLLCHEGVGFSPDPPAAVFRQYWRDFESLETWTRTLPHMAWWQEFLRDPQGTEFWHEAYFKRGGIEGIYDNMSGPTGLMHFAPVHPARGPMFSSRARLGVPGTSEPVAGAEEETLYANVNE